jgi:hypothetical protein
MMSTTVVTPVSKPVVVEAESVSYADASRELEAANLEVLTCEQALKAALQVRADAANRAVEIGVAESTARNDVLRQHNQDVQAQAHADAYDRAKLRERDVIDAAATPKTLPVSRLPIGNEGEVLLSTPSRMVPPLSK